MGDNLTNSSVLRRQDLAAVSLASLRTMEEVYHTNGDPTPILALMSALQEEGPGQSATVLLPDFLNRFFQLVLHASKEDSAVAQVARRFFLHFDGSIERQLDPDHFIRTADRTLFASMKIFQLFNGQEGGVLKLIEVSSYQSRDPHIWDFQGYTHDVVRRLVLDLTGRMSKILVCPEEEGVGERSKDDTTPLTALSFEELVSLDELADNLSRSALVAKALDALVQKILRSNTKSNGQQNLQFVADLFNALMQGRLGKLPKDPSVESDSLELEKERQFRVYPDSVGGGAEQASFQKVLDKRAQLRVLLNTAIAKAFEMDSIQYRTHVGRGYEHFAPFVVEPSVLGLLQGDPNEGIPHVYGKFAQYGVSGLYLDSAAKIMHARLQLPMVSLMTRNRIRHLHVDVSSSGEALKALEALLEVPEGSSVRLLPEVETLHVDWQGDEPLSEAAVEALEALIGRDALLTGVHVTMKHVDSDKAVVVPPDLVGRLSGLTEGAFHFMGTFTLQTTGSGEPVALKELRQRSMTWTTSHRSGRGGMDYTATLSSGGGSSSPKAPGTPRFGRGGGSP